MRVTQISKPLLNQMQASRLHSAVTINTCTVCQSALVTCHHFYGRCISLGTSITAGHMPSAATQRVNVREDQYPTLHEQTDTNRDSNAAVTRTGQIMIV
jgi:hypothetical protein